MPGGYDPKVEERSQITRHLLTDGQMGELPEWYISLRAAKYLGCKPWELIEQPVIWQEYALAAVRAEGTAQEQRAQRK